MSNIEATVAANVKRFRILLGLKQREVGERMLRELGADANGNVPANVMSRIEKGERKVSAAELHELSKILGCGMDELAGVTESPDPLAGKLKASIEEAIASVMGGGSRHSAREVLTVDDLAERYSVPKQTIYVWNMNGTGPRIMHIGRHVRYRLADVIEWEESRLGKEGER